MLLPVELNGRVEDWVSECCVLKEGNAFSVELHRELGPIATDRPPQTASSQVETSLKL